MKISIKHCMKSVRIWSFSSPYFPAFGLNTERCGVFLIIAFRHNSVLYLWQLSLNPLSRLFFSSTTCILGKFGQRDSSVSSSFKLQLKGGTTGSLTVSLTRESGSNSVFRSLRILTESESLYSVTILISQIKRFAIFMFSNSRRTTSRTRLLLYFYH